MKLYFDPSPLWEPERYRYAAEQMMLTLFPGQRPEYPAGAPGEGDFAILTLSRGASWVTATARLCWAGAE